MKYQETILHNYKKIFPNAKLREVSEHTGIHMTRVFRLFNGAEMKVSELEAFDSVLESHSGSHRGVLKDLKEYVSYLSIEKLVRFNKQIKMQLQTYQYRESLKLKTNEEDLCQILH